MTTKQIYKQTAGKEIELPFHWQGVKTAHVAGYSDKNGIILGLKNSNSGWKWKCESDGIIPNKKEYKSFLYVEKEALLCLEPTN